MRILDAQPPHHKHLPDSGYKQMAGNCLINCSWPFTTAVSFKENGIKWHCINGWLQKWQKFMPPCNIPLQLRHQQVISVFLAWIWAGLRPALTITLRWSWWCASSRSRSKELCEFLFALFLETCLAAMKTNSGQNAGEWESRGSGAKSPLLKASRDLEAEPPHWATADYGCTREPCQD